MTPDYAKGCAAGKRAERNDKKHAVFCAALTGLLARGRQTTWTMKAKPVTTLPEYVALASDFADEWGKKHA